MLDHNLYDLRRHTDMTYMMAYLYKESHKTLRNDYETNSKRSKMEMKDTIEIQDKTVLLANDEKTKSTE